MKNVNSTTSTPNILDSRFSHITPNENYRKGPLLLDVSSKENLIKIKSESQSIKSPTIYKSDLSIMSPGSNSELVQGHSLIKLKSVHQESYFHSADLNQKVQEQWTNEIEEIPQQLDGFQQLIENQHSQPFEEQEVNQIHFLDNFYRQLIGFIYFQCILTIICLPYATATNSLVIYYVLLLLRVIDIFAQIKLQFPNQKSIQLYFIRQCIQSTQFEIAQIGGIFCLILLTHTFVIKWLFAIFVLLCMLPKIEVQELSLKLGFGLQVSRFYILCPIFKLSIFVHILTCIWYSFNQDSEDNGSNNDYWDSLFAVVSIISFNNQTTVTQKNQKFCFALVSLSGLFILAYIIHSTKELFGPSKQDLSLLKQVFNRVHIPLKLRIVKYCNEQLRKSNKKKKLILPNQIASKIAIHEGQRLLKRFFGQYEESTLIKSVDFCEEITFESEEIVLKEGQVDDCSIYFILEGKVKIVDRHREIVFCKKEAGQCFGEYAFFTQHPRSATVVSDSYCKLLKLKRIDFQSCLSWKDKQFFQVEYEQMIFAENYKWECYCCNSHRHTINQCPKLTFKPQKLKVLTKYITNSINNRFKFQRGRVNQHQSAWVIKQQIKAQENNIQFLLNDFCTPTSCLTSLCQLPYDENLKESVMNQSSCQSELQSFNQLLEKQEHKFDNKVERNVHSRQTQITAGFGLQFPSKILTDSKLESINEMQSLEAIEQQDFHLYEKSIAYSSPDCVETWVQQRPNPQNQKYRTTQRSLRSKSSKKQSTGTKSNFQSNFTPFSAFEVKINLFKNFNEDNFDQGYNFPFYRPTSNLEQILQILQLNQQ